MDIYEANEWEAVLPQMPAPLYREAAPTASEDTAIIEAVQANTQFSLSEPETRAAIAEHQQPSRKERRVAAASARKSKRRKSVH